MRPAEVGIRCEVCGGPTSYADVAVCDASKPGYTPAECGFRTQPLCWLHGAERKRISTARVFDVLLCKGQGIGRIDRDRCGGDVNCLDCGRSFRSHPKDLDHPYLNVLCDGSLVKL